MDCPHLPGPVREFAVAGRARYLGHTPPGQRDPWTGPAPVTTQLPRPKAADQPVEAALVADVLEGEPDEVVMSSSGHPAAGPETPREHLEARATPVRALSKPRSILRRPFVGTLPRGFLPRGWR